jgi:hypothetical protein
LFDCAVDYSNDIFRNIRGIKISQDLFDDLIDDPEDWNAANTIDIYTHPLLSNAPLIQRPFDYSKNEFIHYPFENITTSRYSDGSVACWYGSETLETSIYETSYHFHLEVQNSYDIFYRHKTITIDRRVALVHCHGLAFDLSQKVSEFPWLVDPINDTRCQAIGLRVAREGHPLLVVPSARQAGGINLVVFNEKILSNVRDHCTLQYTYNLLAKTIKIARGCDELMVIMKQ